MEGKGNFRGENKNRILSGKEKKILNLFWGKKMDFCWGEKGIWGGKGSFLRKMKLFLGGKGSFLKAKKAFFGEGKEVWAGGGKGYFEEIKEMALWGKRGDFWGKKPGKEKDQFLR